jgi:cytochrome P450
MRSCGSRQIAGSALRLTAGCGVVLYGQGASTANPERAILRSVEFDLDDPMLLWRDDVLADPRPLYDRLRRDSPVWRLPGQQTYLISDPGLIQQAVALPKELSSNLVSVLHLGEDGDPVTFDMGAVGDTTNVLATADPPAHTRQRKLLQGHFSTAALTQLEQTIRDIVDEQLAPIVAAGGGDAVTGLSNPVPALTICLIVGVAPQHAAFVMERVTATGPLMDGVADLDGMVSAGNAALELMDFTQTQLNAARSTPPDDRSGLLGVLIDAIDAKLLDPEEARNLLVLLFNAGTETTSSLIANTIETLACDAELQDELRRDPARIPSVLERVLRDDGPFQFHYRWSTTDVDLGGTRIPANSRVLLMWAAANRPSPDEAGRTPGEPSEPTTSAHLAFGRGLHFCIGAPLARLEARIAISRLLASTTHIRLDPDHAPERPRSIFLRRHASLPLIVD